MINRRIVNHLQKASKDKDEKELKIAYQCISSEVQDDLKIYGSNTTVYPDSLVLCAEIAAELNKWDIANVVLEWYFVSNPPRDQFFCRAFFVKALVAADVAKGLKHPLSTDQQIKAISYIMQGVDSIKTHLARYDFLVYNASVLYWRLARPLLRDGVRTKLLPTLKVLSKYLEDINEADIDWRTRYLIQLAKAYEDSGFLEDAIKTAALASQLLFHKTGRPVSATVVPTPLKVETFKLQIHLCKNNTEALAKLKPESLTNPLLRASFVIQSTKSKAKDNVKLGPELKEVLSYIPPLGERLEHEITAEVGRVALLYNNFVLAKECAERIAASKFLKCRILSEFIICELLVIEYITPPSASHNVAALSSRGGTSTRSVVAAPFDYDEEQLHSLRSQAVRRLASALELGLRLAGEATESDNDIYVMIEDNCVLIWNLGYPLLQDRTRMNVHKGFEAAAAALETIASGLVELRAKFHYEVALCEMKKDTLAKAMSQAEKAILLNESTEFFHSCLAPLKRKLELKTNLYSDTNAYSEMEQAFLLVEELKEAKETTLQKTLLIRAIQHLSSLPPMGLGDSQTENGNQPMTFGSIHDLPAALTTNQILLSTSTKAMPSVAQAPLGSPIDRASLWHEVIQFASKKNFHEIVLNATKQFLEVSWLKANSRDISTLTAQAHFMRAQSLLAQQSPDLDSAVQHLLSGMRIGVSLKESWVVFNAVILIWNAYFNVIKQSRQNEITEALQECFQALMQVNSSYSITAPRDLELVASVANALACAHEQTYLKKKKSTNETGDKDDKKKRVGGAAPDGLSDLKLAEDVCKGSLALAIPATYKRALLATLTRIQRYKGVTPQAGAAEKMPMRGPEGESQIVSLLELLATEHESRKRDLLAKALDLLDQAHSSNTELMTMIAVEYYTLGDFSTSLQIAAHSLQQIPAEDKSTLDSVAPKQWRWFAVNEILCGQNIVGLLSGMKNEKTEKAAKSDRAQSPQKLLLMSLTHRTIKLYKQACDHFAQGAKYGAMAAEKSLVIQAATNYWNAGLVLMPSGDTRWILLATVQMVIHSLRAVQDNTWSLKIPLYKLYLRCLIDQKTWGEGLKVAEQTMKRIPKIYHESLWEERIVFKSNIKRTVEPYASALKDNNKSLLAKSYIIVARTNSDKEKCNTAYQKAISALVDLPMDSIQYRMEYAHYLYSNCFPMNEARAMLVEAIDLLTGIEAASFEIDIFADEETDQQLQSAMRLTSKTKKTTTSIRGKDGKESKFKSQVTSLQQSMQDKQQQSEMRGVLTVQHQATLAAVFVMLSTISPPAVSSNPTSASVRVDLLLMAHHWIIRIWQGFFAHAAKNPPPKPGKDETLADLPKFAQEWASLLLTEEVASRLRVAGNPFITAIRSRDGLVRGIGSEAYLTYLMYLSKHLEAHGYYLHSLPVLQLARILVGELSPKPLVMPLLAQINLMLHNVCQKLHLEEHARIWMDLADGAVTQAYELRGHFADELQYHELLQAMQRDANFFNPLSTKSDANASKIDARPIEKTNVRVVYRQLARLLIDYLNLRYAKQFVAEASAHATVYADKVTQAWCYHLSAKIHFIEGDHHKALQLQHQALLSDIGEVEFWAESYTCLADIYLAIDPFSTSKPLTLLGNALEALNKQEEEWPNLRPDILVAQATILNKYGSLCTHQGAGSNKIAIEYEALEAAMGVHEQSLQNFKQLGCIPQIVNALMSLSKLVTDNLHVLSSALVLQHSLEDGETPLDADASPSLELLSKAMELLLQADEYASNLLSATVFGEFKGEISPPIVDQLAAVKLAIGQLEWTMADLTAEQNQRRKETIEQLLDRFERQHQTIVTPEEQFSSHSHRNALAFLNSAHALLPASPLAMFWLAIHLMSYSAKLGKPHTPWKSIAFSEEPTVGNQTMREADLESNISSRPGSPTSALNPAQIFSTSAPLPEQAITLMMQSVEIARKQFPSLVSSASLTLVDWLGSLSSSGSARYPSLKAAKFKPKSEMLEIFNSVLPASEREKILIHLESTFKQNFAYPQLLQPYRSTMEYLNSQSLVWPRLDCDGNFQDIIDALPKGVSVLVFHHTSDFRVMYLSCVASDANPVVARVETDPEQFSLIIRKKRNFEALARANSLKVAKNDLNPPDLSNLEPVPPPVEQSSKSLKKSATLTEAPSAVVAEETDETVLAFADLLETSELFFAPLWNAFPKAARESHVVLVVDSALSNVPLEALHVFVKAKSITREHATRSSTQKYNFTYITDPRNEDTPTQSLPLYKSMSDLFSEDFLPSRKKSDKLVQEGVLGSDHTPTPEEWQKLMGESSHFIYFGFSPLFSYLEPNYIACLNITACSTMILVDKATNEASHRRQTKMDISKSFDEKRLLTAHNTCTLLSLRGVTSTVINQWHTTQKINSQLLFEVHDLMNQNKSTSEALQQMAVATAFPVAKPNASSATLNISRGQSRQQIHEQHLQQVLLYQQHRPLQQSQDAYHPTPVQTHEADKNTPPVSREYVLRIAKIYHKFNAVCYGCTFPSSAPKK